MRECVWYMDLYDVKLCIITDSDFVYAFSWANFGETSATSSNLLRATNDDQSYHKLEYADVYAMAASAYDSMLRLQMFFYFLPFRLCFWTQ